MNNPKLLILSGMHGDEWEVIDIVSAYLQTHAQELPAFTHIPNVSPSAVDRRTRKNAFGHDVNRSFFDPPKDPEVAAFMSRVQGQHFDVALNFHEDPDLASTFYLYDSAVLPDDNLLELRSRVVEAGAGLHTGKDDPMDANLGFHVEKGYVSTPYDIMPQNAGFSWVWFHKNGITKRDMDIEIPGKAPKELKEKLIAIIFDTIPRWIISNGT